MEVDSVTRVMLLWTGLALSPFLDLNTQLVRFMIIQTQGVSSDKVQTLLRRTSDNKLRYGLSTAEERALLLEVPPLPTHGRMESNNDRSNEVCEKIESVMDTYYPISPGYFYYAEVQNAAHSNPELEIVGLGRMRSPVTEEELQSLSSISTPFNGDNHQRSVEMDVSNSGCWEIGSEMVSVTNPSWHQWIKDCEVNICKKLCPEFLYLYDADDDDAMSTEDDIPKMVLRRMRIWRPCAGKESSILCVSRTRSFATVMVNLPSEYSGGQTTISNFTTSRMIDLSPDSGKTTSNMAWQNGVHFNTKNITSGLRISLIYDIILPSYCPRPTLPDNNNIVNELSDILQKWAAGKYKDVPPHNFAAYLLRNYYPDDVLSNQGEMSLDGLDRQMLAIFQDAAARAGFKVGLTSVTRTETGLSYPRVDGKFYSDGIPVMDEVAYTDNYIGPRFVYPDGHSLVEFSSVYGAPDQGTIIPTHYDDILQGIPPTDKKYNDNDLDPEVPGRLYLEYCRTAVVMFRADQKDATGWYLGGIPHALKQIHPTDLENCNQPSESEKTWSMKILRATRGHRINDDGMLKLADCSVSWNNVEIWNELAESSGCTFRVLGNERLMRAWKTFGFANISNSFQKIFTKLSDVMDIPDKIDFLYAIVQDTSNDQMGEVCSWCRTIIKDLLSSSWRLDPIQVVIPVVIKVLKYTPPDLWFRHYTLPNILKTPDSFMFLISLLEALKENQQVIVQRQIEINQTPLFVRKNPPENRDDQSQNTPVSLSDWSQVVDNLAVKCLVGAASQWAVPEPEDPKEEHVPSGRPPTLPFDMLPKIRNVSIQRILKVVGLAFNRMGNKGDDVCKYLLEGVLKRPGSLCVKFIELYIPLIGPLRELLRNHDRTVSSTPFVGFFRFLIGRYLSDILGRKSEVRNHRLRRVGCARGCLHCRVLDTFMLDPSTSEQLYTMPKPRRLHFEHVLSFSPDLCAFETVATRPSYSILVKKLHSVVLAGTWDRRVVEAREFLAGIGTEEEVRKVMGDRYEDVKNALEGVQHFVADSNASVLMT